MDGAGLNAVAQNMRDILACDWVSSIFPLDAVTRGRKKCVVSLHIDGVNIDKQVNLDTSVMPHQISGVYHHCTDTNFVTFKDAERISDGISNCGFHYAQESDIFSVGSNDGACASLITIVESPTCKKDVVNAESTDNIMAIVSKIIETYHELGLHTPVGPLVPINPDGTSHFRKASGQKLSLDLPTQVGAKFVSVFGELCCPFFNCVGGC